MIKQVRNVFVNAQVAKEFLALEKQPEIGVKGTNRKFSDVVVNNYAYEMLAGRWRETHQGLAFKGFLDDGTAEYVDGGQRARALIQAATQGARIGAMFYEPKPEIGFWFMVSEGLTAEDVKALDKGKGRSPADSLQMGGYGNKNLLASAARLCILFETVPWSPDAWRKHPTPAAVLEQYVDDNPGLVESVREGARLHTYFIASAASAGHHEAIKSGFDPDVVNEFMDLVHNGANLPELSPVLAVRRLLTRGARNKRKWTREEQLAVFIKAFMKWYDKVPTENIVFKTKGDAPDVFPVFKP